MCTKKCIADFRIRKIEKEYIESLGYDVMLNPYDFEIYDEISSHVDIYYTKLKDCIFCSPNKYIENIGLVKGIKTVGSTYPDDIPYNVCVIGKLAIHNFKYTDDILKQYLVKDGYRLVNVNQGYTKCSISVLDDKTCVTSDIEIAKALLEYNVDAMYVQEPEIKLLKRTNNLFKKQEQLCFEYSTMSGFIGGAMVRLGDTIILFGDKNRLLNGRKIEKKVLSLGLKFKDFEGLDVIDYGGILEVNQ